MKTIILTIFTACFLTGCAYNFGVNASKINDYSWVAETSSWEIASDLYTLTHRHPGTLHTDGYFYPKINNVDPRLLEHFKTALTKKGYTIKEAENFGNIHITEKMPAKMQTEWITDTKARFIAADLLLLTGNSTWLRKSHPQQSFFSLPGRYSKNTEKSENLCRHALKRKGWTDKTLKSLMNGHLCVGMPESGLFALWGKPSDTIEHTSAFGTSKQHQYVSNNLHYISIQNGKVISWTKF